MKPIKFKRKGNIIADSFIIMLILFIAVIAIPFIYKFMSDLNTATQSSQFSAQGKSTMNTITNQFPDWMDNAILGAFILLWIGAVIASFMIDSHPMFFIFVIILWLGLLVGTAWLSNTYEDIMASPNISVINAEFPKSAFIMGHLVEYMILVGVSIGLSLFAKTRSQ